MVTGSAASTSCWRCAATAASSAPPSSRRGSLSGDLVRAPAVLALGAVVEGRVGEDVVGLERGVFVVGVRVAQLDIPVDAVDEQVHPA